jgi:Flp pilus assembly protein TadD
MDAKPRISRAGKPRPDATTVPPASTAVREPKPSRRPFTNKIISPLIIAVVILLGVAGAVYLGYEQFRIFRVARMVRAAFSARRYAEAREPLHRWLVQQPRSGEAYFYKAWQALSDEEPQQAVLAVDRARELGFDSDRLDCLVAIYHARAGRFGEAEPVLEQAFLDQSEPLEMVAKEIARIFLSSYRLERAAQAIERWRVLAPADPQPYLWTNEILARSDVEHAVLIQNYRAALERDPKLDKALLGLAQELSKDRRFDEAEQEFLTYLKRKPNDTLALLGLGRNAFQQGDIEKANQYFTSALQSNPRDPETLKELAQIDLRLGRSQQARERLALLTQLEPFDHEVRYSYAQALKLAGDEPQSRAELANSVRLRKEHDQLVQLRYRLVKTPGDLEVRFQVAKWMLEHGHQDEGLKWTKEILRADPRHVATHRVLATYYDKKGDSGLANYHRVAASSGQDSESESKASKALQAP